MKAKVTFQDKATMECIEIEYDAIDLDTIKNAAAQREVELMRERHHKVFIKSIESIESIEDVECIVDSVDSDECLRDNDGDAETDYEHRQTEHGD